MTCFGYCCVRLDFEVTFGAATKIVSKSSIILRGLETGCRLQTEKRLSSSLFPVGNMIFMPEVKDRPLGLVWEELVGTRREVLVFKLYHHNFIHTRIEAEKM